MDIDSMMVLFGLFRTSWISLIPACKSWLL